MQQEIPRRVTLLIHEGVSQECGGTLKDQIKTTQEEAHVGVG